MGSIKLHLWQKLGLPALVVNNIGQAALCRNQGWEDEIFAGPGCNIYNSAACRYLRKNRFRRAVLSPELNLGQLHNLDDNGLETEVFAQGALQLMVSEYCLQGGLMRFPQPAKRRGRALSQTLPQPA